MYNNLLIGKSGFASALVEYPFNPEPVPTTSVHLMSSHAKSHIPHHLQPSACALFAFSAGQPRASTL
jgi:hypothetical protein